MPGETMPLSLYWSSPAAIDRTTGFSFTSAGMGRISSRRTILGTRRAAHIRWVPNEVIRDSYAFVIPADASGGDYLLEVGLFNPQTQQRLPVTNPGAVPQGINLLS